MRAGGGPTLREDLEAVTDKSGAYAVSTHPGAALDISPFPGTHLRVTMTEPPWAGPDHRRRLILTVAGTTAWLESYECDTQHLWATATWQLLENRAGALEERWRRARDAAVLSVEGYRGGA